MENEDLIVCLLVTTRAVGDHSFEEILFERFFSPTNAVDDEERAACQKALYNVSAPLLRGAVDEEPYVASYREHHVVWMCLGGLVLYIVGSGIYDELALAEVLSSVCSVVKTVTKSKSPAENVFRTYFGKFCLALDEVIHAGQVELLDKDAIFRATKLKAPKGEE